MKETSSTEYDLLNRKRQTSSFQADKKDVSNPSSGNETPDFFAKTPEYKESNQLKLPLLFVSEDVREYFIPFKGEILLDRYEIQSILGKGVFSTVLKCLDVTKGSEVAVKVLRRSDEMRSSGEHEISIIDKLTEDKNEHYTVQKIASFEHKGHLCVVLELLSTNLREFIKDQGGLSIIRAKLFAKQMLLALERLDAIGFIHCDCSNLISQTRQHNGGKFKEIRESVRLRHMYVTNRDWRQFLRR